MAGDTRRWRDACERLAVVCAADTRARADRFAALPQIVALVDHDERRALGLTVEGVPVELVVAEPARFGTALLRATGVGRVRRRARAAPRRARRGGRLRRAGRAVVPAGAARGSRSAASRRRSLELDRHPRRPALPHDVVGRPRERRGDGPRGARARLRVPRDLRPHAGGRRRPGLTPDDVRRQGEEIAAANERLAPFRVLRGIECDILPDGRLDLPDDVLAELDWVQASVHGGQRMPAREMTARVEEAIRNPHVRCLSHPTGRLINRRPENATDLERIFAVAREHGVAVEVNGLRPAARPARRARPRRDRGRRAHRLLDRRPPALLASASWSCRCTPRAAAARRPPTCSTPAR